MFTLNLIFLHKADNIVYFVYFWWPNQCLYQVLIFTSLENVLICIHKYINHIILISSSIDSLALTLSLTCFFNSTMSSSLASSLYLRFSASANSARTISARVSMGGTIYKCKFKDIICLNYRYSSHYHCIILRFYMIF